MRMPELKINEEAERDLFEQAVANGTDFPIESVRNLRVIHEGHMVYMTDNLTAMWQGWRWRAAKAKLGAQEVTVKFTADMSDARKDLQSFIEDRNHWKARAEAAESDAASWADQCSQRVADWDEMRIRAEVAEAALKEAQEQEQEPVAFWWIGPDGKDNGGPYRGKPSDAAIDNALNMGCEPVLLYARPVPAAPAVADWDVNIERIRDVMHMMGISIEESVEGFSAALPTNINRMTLAMKRHLQELAGMTAAPAPAVAVNISDNFDANTSSAARIDDNSSAPTVAVPAVQDDCVSQDGSTMMMAASALALYRAGESAEYMAKAIEALLQSDE